MIKKMALENALKTKKPDLIAMYSGNDMSAEHARHEANKKYLGFYKAGKRYTNGVDTIEVKEVEEYTNAVRFSIINGDDEIINFNWLDEIEGFEHEEGEFFENSYMYLVEMGFLKEA